MGVKKWIFVFIVYNTRTFCISFILGVQLTTIDPFKILLTTETYVFGIHILNSLTLENLEPYSGNILRQNKKHNFLDTN